MLRTPTDKLTIINKKEDIEFKIKSNKKDEYQKNMFFHFFF